MIWPSRPEDLETDTVDKNTYRDRCIGLLGFPFTSSDSLSACWVPRRLLLWTSNRDNDAKQWMCRNGFRSFGWQIAFRLFFCEHQGWLRSSAGEALVVVVANTEQGITQICMWWQIYRWVFSWCSFRAGRAQHCFCFTLSQFSALRIVSIPVQSQFSAEGHRMAPLQG